jgi:NADPH:quinone reductase-like Zn-dependent oxidoreductase
MGLNPWHANKVEDLEFLGKLHKEAKVKPVIDKIYPLTDVPMAYRYLEDGKAKGNWRLEIEKCKIVFYFEFLIYYLLVSCIL